MKTANFISDARLRDKQNKKKRLLQVSAKLKGRDLFPEKMASAQHFLDKLEHFPA
jgi:hypothetical protein